MSNETGMNVIKMRVNEMIDLMAPLYASCKNYSQKEGIPSLMLWGPPGIGKSQGIDALGKKVQEITGKQVVKTDARLLLFNPVDLRGIPVADAKRELAIWLKPAIFQMDPSDSIINILFLDEISAAPLSVQAAAYQMTLDRVIGEHKIPDNCIVVAAGNRITDKSVAYKMPKALGNRMTHIEITSEVEDWKRWAIPHGIDSKIIGYINYKNSALFGFDPSTDDVAFPSPRSWEMVDKYLKKLNANVDIAFPLVAGSVGMGTATEFKAYTKVFNELPDIKAIYEGTETTVPKEPDVLYALSAALASYSVKADIKQLANFLKYSSTMPAEFAALTVKDMAQIKQVKDMLLKCPEWMVWCKKHKSFIM